MSRQDTAKKKSAKYDPKDTAKKKSAKYDPKDTAKKKSAKYDPICGSRFINMLVNRMMTHGKKSLAYQIFYRAAIDIKRNTGKNPISVFREALFRVTPKLIVKTRKRKKGKTFRIPLQIPFSKGALFGIRWLLGASRQRSGKNMASQLSAELRDAAFKKRGDAIRKKEQSHKMAERNRTFAHFRSPSSKFLNSAAYKAALKRKAIAEKRAEKRRIYRSQRAPRRLQPVFYGDWISPLATEKQKREFFAEVKKDRILYAEKHARFVQREEERRIYFEKKIEERRIRMLKREEEERILILKREEGRRKREEERRKREKGRSYFPNPRSPLEKDKNSGSEKDKKEE